MFEKKKLIFKLYIGGVLVYIIKYFEIKYTINENKKIIKYCIWFGFKRKIIFVLMCLHAHNTTCI